MKKIIVSYCKKEDLIPYFKNNSVFEYTLKQQNEIVQIIIERGFSVLIKPNMGHDKDTLLIYIDFTN